MWCLASTAQTTTNATDVAEHTAVPGLQACSAEPLGALKLSNNHLLLKKKGHSITENFTHTQSAAKPSLHYINRLNQIYLMNPGPGQQRKSQGLQVITTHHTLQ